MTKLFLIAIDKESWKENRPVHQELSKWEKRNACRCNLESRVSLPTIYIFLLATEIAVKDFRKYKKQILFFETFKTSFLGKKS